MQAPDFWDHDDLFSYAARTLLAPVGTVYGATVWWKSRNARPYRARIPVICIGNITAGGNGKTPTAIAVADAIIARGKAPFFLTRGYGGRSKGPLVVTATHRAEEVGDEPLLLSRKAVTVVARNRREGAVLAEDRGADVIIMDDGHQNFALAKDLSIVVIDAERGFGNGLVLPAGPLREPAAQGLARADAILLMGDGNPLLPPFKSPSLRAKLAPDADQAWRGQRAVAFAGIGRPEKLFETLSKLGANLVETVGFADHHRYTPNEIADLKRKARDQNAHLVTTEKDFVRLSETERGGISALSVRAVIEPLADLDRLLDRVFAPR